MIRFLLLLLVTAASSLAGTFETARDQLNKHQPEAALQTLRPRMSTMSASAGEWELAGLSYWNAYGQDSIASALRCVTVATRLSNAESARQLKAWLEQKVENRIEGIQAPGLVSWLLALPYRIPGAIPALLFVLGAGLLAVTSMTLQRLPISGWRKSQNLFLFGMIAVVFGVSFGWWQQHVLTKPIAFVTESGVTVKQQPDFSSKEIATVSAGTEVELVSDFGRWTQVKLPDGRIGWIQVNLLLPLRM